MENNFDQKLNIDRENAKSFIKRINNSVKTFSSQIESWQTRKDEFMKSFGIGNGIITGLIASVLSSDIPKNIILFFIGLGLLIVAEFVWVFHEKSFLSVSKPYVKHLSYISKRMTEYSSLFNRFLNGKQKPTYQEITDKFLSDNEYSKMHDDYSFEQIDQWNNEEIKNDTKMDILMYCFVFGLLSIFVSLAYPYLEVFLFRGI